MKPVQVLKIAASTLILGAGVSAYGANEAPVSATAAKAAKAAGEAHADSKRLLAKGKFDRAVALAEDAVAWVPDSAAYRTALGQAYMKAGRLQSAETAFSDALVLDSTNGRAGLSLALMQIALGRGENALATLDQHREAMAAADFGLAVALAGDAEGAIKVLEHAVRAPGADVKTRQNLALAYALAGQWSQARVMAALDVPHNQLDRRILEWARFASPASASEQVASLMGFSPGNDPGQPQRLALVKKPVQAAQLTIPLDAPAPATIAEEPKAAAAELPAPSFEVAAAPVAPAPAPVSVPVIRAEPTPVKQVVVPASKPVRKAAVPIKRAAVAPLPFKPVEGGRYVVQLGAYDNARMVEYGWNRATGRVRGLNAFTPYSARVVVNGATYHRLSVSGFATRASATAVCARVKAAGGNCFVRSISGDQPLTWASRGNGTRLAARR